MTCDRPNRRPLSVVLPAPEAELIRDFAQAQGATYLSAVCACVRQMLQAGGPLILDPFGDYQQRTNAAEKGKI